MCIKFFPLSSWVHIPIFLLLSVLLHSFFRPFLIFPTLSVLSPFNRAPVFPRARPTIPPWSLAPLAKASCIALTIPLSSMSDRPSVLGQLLLIISCQAEHSLWREAAPMSTSSRRTENCWLDLGLAGFLLRIDDSLSPRDENAKWGASSSFSMPSLHF